MTGVRIQERNALFEKRGTDRRELDHADGAGPVGIIVSHDVREANVGSEKDWSAVIVRLWFRLRRICLGEKLQALGVVDATHCCQLSHTLSPNQIEYVKYARAHRRVVS